jgi:hypothetical protein
MRKNNEFTNAIDFRKSLESRLQNEAKKQGLDLQRVRRQVAFDRLLARFFFTPNPPFFLKGGYAMELRLSYARTTKDLDLTYLQKIRNDNGSKSDLVLHELQKLASIDLGDFFTYTLGESQLDLDNAPYGGARYPISTFIGNNLFVRFHLDVGNDFLISKTENMKTYDWLSFYQIPPPIVQMISLEQQIAEKIHAYTLPRGNKLNSRVKDLIDILLLLKMKKLDRSALVLVLQQVFKKRNIHAVPLQLLPPPAEWTKPYAALATECGLGKDIMTAFQEVSEIYSNIVTEKI